MERQVSSTGQKIIVRRAKVRVTRQNTAFIQTQRTALVDNHVTLLFVYFQQSQLRCVVIFVLFFCVSDRV